MAKRGRPRKNPVPEPQLEETPQVVEQEPPGSVSELWSGIKHFKPRDFACNCSYGACMNGRVPISMNVVRALDRVADAVDKPIKVNRGVICQQANKGNGPSPHLIDKDTGVAYAVDIETQNVEMRYKIMKAALDAGFNHIGIGSYWLHLELNPKKDSNLMWIRSGSRRR